MNITTKEEKGKTMGIVVNEKNIHELFSLLKKMDRGYVPSNDERAYLGEIEIISYDRVKNGQLPPLFDVDFIEFGTTKKVLRHGFSGTENNAIPESIGNLTNLQELDLCGTEINAIPESIGNLKNLRKLDLSYTRINVIPESIGNLTNLQWLILSYTKINAIPESIGNLTNLQILNLYHTQISGISESIGKLTNLISLDLSYTQINAIPESIGKLTNLLDLILSGTEISVIPECIGNLINLRYISLSNTKINVFPESICNLKSLQQILISDTQISTITESITRLTNLAWLDLSNTQISVIPKRIDKLKYLQNLDLSGTDIRVLPDILGNLTHLEKLNLSKMSLDRIPESVFRLGLEFSFDPKAKKGIILYETTLAAQPISIFHQPRELIAAYYNKQENLDNDIEIINLTDGGVGKDTMNNDAEIANHADGGVEKNTLNNNAEIANHADGNTGNTALVNDEEFVSNIKKANDSESRLRVNEIPNQANGGKGKKTLIYDAKVIFLGDGGVGKTYTIQRLMNGGKQGEYNPELTKGINITTYPTEYNGNSVNIRFWDFGGQEIMHSMHRCFLTDHTCYVVIVSNRFGNRTQRARYWLRNIESFAPGCPVILAVNRWNTNAGTDDVNRELLVYDFPNIQEIVTYSAKGSKVEEFNLLTKVIIEQASKLDSCGREFPESWANIRDALLSFADKEPYISKKRFLTLCREYGEKRERICGQLLDLFNDMGVCFSYHTDRESGKELESYQVLSPQWLVNAIYILINDGGDDAQQGILTQKGILNHLQNGGGTNPGIKYKKEECYYILEVMRKFGISYSNDGITEFIPALCPDNWEVTPKTTGWDDKVTYEMRYAYLPDSVLHRLMIYCKKNNLLKQVWRSGMEISYEMGSLSAVITSEEDESLLHIDVYAKTDHKPWELLKILRDELYLINGDLHLNAEDIIVKKKRKQTAHFPVESLLKAEEKGIDTLYAMDGGELEEYPVNVVLGSVFGAEKVNSNSKYNIYWDWKKFLKRLRND